MNLTEEQRKIILENLESMQKALRESQEILKDMTSTTSEFKDKAERLKEI